jgi:hypothetical protein
VDFSPLLRASCLEPSGEAVEIQKICFVARATGSHIILKIHILDFKVFEKKNMHGANNVHRKLANTQNTLYSRLNKNDYFTSFGFSFVHHMQIYTFVFFAE